MANQMKEKMVSEIQKSVEESNVMWVVDYRGLTVKQTEALRGLLRKQEASMKVFKNTLVKRVLSAAEMPVLDEVLAGPSAFVFASGDPVASAKALKDFAKGNPQLIVKGGILDGSEMTPEQVKAIADLPSREELLAKLVGTMQNPMSGLVRVLNGSATGLVQALDQIAKQKSAA